MRIVPLYGNSAVAVSEVAITQLASGWVVTATCDPCRSQMELAVWQGTGAALTQASTITANLECYSVALVAITPNTVITVNDNYHAYVIAWNVSSKGVISILPGMATVSPDGVAQVAITQISSTEVVTAICDKGENLTVTSWYIPSGGDVTQLNSAQTGCNGGAAVTAVDYVKTGLVVTAATDGSNDLYLVSWTVGGSGYVAQNGFATAGTVDSLLPVVYWKSNDVVTPLANGSSDLEVIDWSVAYNIKRLATGTAGTIASTTPGACIVPTDNLLFTAVDNSLGNLSVEVWKRSGKNLNKLASYNSTWPLYAYGSSPLRATGISPHRTVTASVQSSSQNLELEVWQLE
jgi:hypothetical protein